MYFITLTYISKLKINCIFRIFKYISTHTHTHILTNATKQSKYKSIIAVALKERENVKGREGSRSERDDWVYIDARDHSI